MNFFKRESIYSKNVLEIFRYFFSGIFTNVLGFLIYFILTSKYLEIDPIKVVIFLIPIIFVFHFALQQIYVFKKKKFKKLFLYKYFFLYLVNYILNIVFLHLSVNKWNFEHNISQLIIIILLASYTYVLSKYFIFR